jgi:S1/P1 Nuclease
VVCGGTLRLASPQRMVLRILNSPEVGRHIMPNITTIANLALSLCWLLVTSHAALCWGDDGHKAIALIAEPCLTSEAKQAVASMLSSDTNNLTKHDIASEATWADKYRDQNHRQDYYQQTQNWHFTDIEIDHPDLTSACFGRPPLPNGLLASNGPAQACAIDKIKQFQAELASPGIDAEERLFALKFILHLVGDLHQPLHSSDNHDRGGNDVKVIVDGFPRSSHDNLHAFWDTQFVDAIAMPPSELARQLRAMITPTDAASWAVGTVDEWAMEAFQLAKTDVYGQPPLSSAQDQHLDANYVGTAEMDVTIQLSRAGVRLSHLLNSALGSKPSDWPGCFGTGR